MCGRRRTRYCAPSACSPRSIGRYLVLVAVQGLSYHECADELGVPAGTVMSRLARARDHLREVLADRPAGVVGLMSRRAMR